MIQVLGLRAPPISSLGLSIHPNEFVIALRIWLGIHCFPSSPLSLCFCGSVIDHNGDHLLGCGHNPLRIRRHESLCDIVYHSLHQDGPLVRREQRLSGASQDLHPVIFFIPIFSMANPPILISLFAIHYNLALSIYHQFQLV